MREDTDRTSTKTVEWRKEETCGSGTESEDGLVAVDNDKDLEKEKTHISLDYLSVQWFTDVFCSIIPIDLFDGFSD